MFDAIVVGAGAAGLMTAIVAAERGAKVLALDGARKIGAKILVSGGGRCNVTNDVVTERDYSGVPHLVRRVLAEFPAARARAMFESWGVPLKVEPGGKIFPRSGRAQDVLDALLRRAKEAGVDLRAGRRVVAVRDGPAPSEVEGFEVQAGETFSAPRVVLATGGRSLPKTGSDGFGYELARRFGHMIVEPIPALVPLTAKVPADLSGVTVDAELFVEGGPRIRGSLLFTHFGLSGPAALDISRHVQRSGKATVYVNFLRARLDGPGHRTARSVLAGTIPARLAALLAPETKLAQLTREARRRVVENLTRWPVAVTGTRGYNHAEVTAGGVPPAEVDLRTMESRKRKGLYLTGEILDVDGRLGGFNFQWAWSTGFIAGKALAK